MLWILYVSFTKHSLTWLQIYISQILNAVLCASQVRGITLKLTEAMNWAQAVRKCLSKIESFLLSKGNCSEKINYGEIEELIAVKHIPCYEPSLTKLQVWDTGYFL